MNQRRRVGEGPEGGIEEIQQDSIGLLEEQAEAKFRRPGSSGIASLMKSRERLRQYSIIDPGAIVHSALREVRR